MSAPANITTPSDETTLLLARASLYRLVTRLLADPVAGPPPASVDLEVALQGAKILEDSEVVRTTAALEPLLPATADDFKKSHTRVFGLLASSEAPPYEVEYEQRGDLFWRAQQLADIKGFYKAYALDLARRDRPDHVAVEAEFLWYLLERRIAAQRLSHGQERQQILEDSFRSFLAGHFAAWVPSFAADLERLATDRDVPFLAATARFLAAMTASEAGRFDLPLSAARKVLSTLPSEPDCERCLLPSPPS
ncbi:MAG: molecular chaperone [Acidobacteriota bacterium]